MIVGPLIASEALAAGLLNRHQLRTRYRPILPGVYFDKTVVPTLYDRTEAAWLWSRRQAVIAGSAAAALLGTKWVDAAVDVDLLYASTKPAAGVRVHRGRLHSDERRPLNGMLVTTPARTGFDLARFGMVTDVDALLKATGITVAEIEAVAKRHRGAPGLRRLEQTLALVDAGAESPKETWLRLLLQRSGLPPVETQIEVRDEFGGFVARLDMGWPELEAGGRVRRRSTSDRPQTVCPRHATARGVGAAGLGSHPGDQGRLRRPDRPEGQGSARPAGNASHSVAETEVESRPGVTRGHSRSRAIGSAQLEWAHHDRTGAPFCPEPDCGSRRIGAHRAHIHRSDRTGRATARRARAGRAQ
jgi:hypothetical protein